MKKLIFFILLIAASTTSFAQYRWEVSGGLTSSSINIENADSNRGTGFYFNAGYGYVMGVRAKTSIVFSIEVLQRNSEIVSNIPTVLPADLKVLQVGFNPKFRYLFGRGKDRFRPFINVGPSFRINTNVELGGVDLESDQYEQLVIGGVYGVGFSQMIGEMFDIFFEAGAMNDFTDNLTDLDSKFFDIYARVGVRFRIYDARR
ncbi:Outer membrane protein beta-barrel domain-containing protein [Aquimarina amphilecti]|uniref:Outer membrane protein beta-barrel domain-containing protein n=1 Tax=Aquimarina amphilecti TaxID=1038014 RepID=A0A1H7I791_AQUAM|nr:outer membrane beta-barrel protein [Aquimarina amphilecti]SEK57627.1 Outer membrane protein beta-barrel domain-containing protein [Aquimarina amphilecti]